MIHLGDLTGIARGQGRRRKRILSADLRAGPKSLPREGRISRRFPSAFRNRALRPPLRFPIFRHARARERADRDIKRNLERVEPERRTGGFAAMQSRFATANESTISRCRSEGKSTVKRNASACFPITVTFMAQSWPWSRLNAPGIGNAEKVLSLRFYRRSPASSDHPAKKGMQVGESGGSDENFIETLLKPVQSIQIWRTSRHDSFMRDHP